MTIAVCLGSALPGPLPAQAGETGSPAHVVTRTVDGGLEIEIQGHELGEASPSADSMELSLRFRGPVGDTLAREVAMQAGTVLSDASSGYDTLLLRAQGPSTFDVATQGQSLTLRITPKDGSEDNFRLSLVEIRRRTMIDDTAGARELLDSLRATRADDFELRRADADISLADGDYRAAAQTLRGMLRDRSDDASLRDSLAFAELQTAPRVEAGADYATIDGGDTQWRVHAGGQVPVSDRMDLGGHIEHVLLEDNLVQFADGRLAPFDGGRSRIEASLSHDLGAGWHVTGLLTGGSGVLGAGAAVTHQAASGASSITAGLNQPSWDYTESIAQDGTRDFVRLSLTRTLARDWFVDLGLGYNRYGLAGEDAAATTTQVEAGLRWQVPIEGPARVSLGYMFDATYAGDVVLRNDGTDDYALLPVRDLVVHEADLKVDGNLLDRLTGSIRAGYAREESGNGGLSWGLELWWTPADDLRVGMTSAYSDVADRAGESGSYFHGGLTVTRIFAASAGDADEH